MPVAIVGGVVALLLIVGLVALIVRASRNAARDDDAESGVALSSRAPTTGGGLSMAMRASTYDEQRALAAGYKSVPSLDTVEEPAVEHSDDEDAIMDNF